MTTNPPKRKGNPRKMPIEKWLVYHKSTIYWRCNGFWNSRRMIDNDDISNLDWMFRHFHESPGEFKEIPIDPIDDLTA